MSTQPAVTDADHAKARTVCDEMTEAMRIAGFVTTNAYDFGQQRIARALAESRQAGAELAMEIAAPTLAEAEATILDASMNLARLRRENAWLCSACRAELERNFQVAGYADAMAETLATAQFDAALQAFRAAEKERGKT